MKFSEIQKPNRTIAVEKSFENKKVVKYFNLTPGRLGCCHLAK